MLFGFSTGVIHQQADARQALRIMKDLGCRAVELGFVRKERIEKGWLAALSADDLAGFDYVSLHAPKVYYQDNAESHEMFGYISHVHENLRPLDLVVFHPDNVVNIDVFKDLPFPVGFELMDEQKPFGKNAEDLLQLLDSYDRFRFIMDTNHIKTNDPSMAMTDELYKRLGDRLAEYHVSGLGDDRPHVPLFQTQQTEILKAVRDISKPIICESNMTIADLQREKQYIESYFST